MSYGRDLVWLVLNLQDDKCDGTRGDISMKVVALEDDLFKRSVKMRR